MKFVILIHKCVAIKIIFIESVFIYALYNFKNKKKFNGLMIENIKNSGVHLIRKMLF